MLLASGIIPGHPILSLFSKDRESQPHDIAQLLFGRALKEVDGRENDTLRRVEILTGSGRRRRWSDEAKTRIVAESFEPGVSVSAVARRYDLSSGLLFLWRRQFAARRPGRVAPEPDFVPVTIASPANASDERTPASITIEIGDIRIKVAGHVDGAALREVMMAIRMSR